MALPSQLTFNTFTLSLTLNNWLMVNVCVFVRLLCCQVIFTGVEKSVFNIFSIAAGSSSSAVFSIPDDGVSPPNVTFFLLHSLRCFLNLGFLFSYYHVFRSHLSLVTFFPERTMPSKIIGTPMQSACGQSTTRMMIS